MNPDGDFESYRFIWSGSEESRGLYSYPPKSGVKVVLKIARRPALKIKAIRSSWLRLASKTASEAKSIAGNNSYFSANGVMKMPSVY